MLIDNRGFASIGGLSESLGSGGFGTQYRLRDPATNRLSGEYLAVDYVANARSLGARAVAARGLDELRAALDEARRADRTTVIATETEPAARVPSYEAWWDVPVAEVSELPSVREVRREYERRVRQERYFL